MGSCVSAHKDSESAMRFRLSFGSKTDKILIPSPVKETNGDRQIALKPHDFGSKEETFFDSQAWLESDCDDDFLSVKGDFTPSRGNTPVHHSFSVGPPLVNKAVIGEQTPGPAPEPEPSPTDKKKRLSELFKESLRGDHDDDNKGNGANGNMEVDPKSVNSTPFVSGANSVCSSERTPNGDFKPVKEKSVKSAQCCLPSLRSSRSYSEKKKKMSPVNSIG